MKKTIVKDAKHATGNVKERIIIEDKTSDFSNNPTIVRKRERALEVIRKYGLPKGW
jgi:hypothetical protein